MARLGELVAAAGAGDELAWEEIVDRFASLVWATARAHRLSRDDAADVAQTTWLRLVENLDRIHNPDGLGAWLATVARRESLRKLRLGARERPSEEIDLFEAPSGDAIDVPLLERERDVALWGAFAALSERCKTLLRLLVSEQEPSYQEVSAALDMPIGSIGPTRIRCVQRLQSRMTRAKLQS